MGKTIREMKKEMKKQIKKVNESLRILNLIEVKYLKYDIKQLRNVLIDLINGYRATLKGVKSTYENELK